MSLYYANPNVNSTALSMFAPSMGVRPSPFAMPLRGQRTDVKVMASTLQPFSGVPKRAGLAGLGDWGSDLIGSITGGAVNIVDSLTGRGAARDQATAAAKVAELQAQARIAEAQASSNMWGAALPAIGIAAAAAIGLGLVLVLKK